MKIECMTCIWMFVYMTIFELPEMAQKWRFGFFRPNLPIVEETLTSGPDGKLELASAWEV